MAKVTSPLHYQRNLSSFNTVTAGSTSAVRIIKGPTYRTLVLKYTPAGVAANEAKMKADLDKIRIKINGVVRFEASATYIIDILNKYYGYAFTDGELVIPLAWSFLRTMTAEDNLGWGTANVDSLDLEVDISSDAVTPQLTASAFVDPDKRDLGAIVEIHEFIRAATGAGELEISDLPRGNGDLLGLHFSSANISKIKIQVNQVDFVNVDLSTVHNLLRLYGKRSTQTNYAHFDPLILNRIDDRIPLKNIEDFRTTVTMSGAGNIGVLMMTLNQPLGAANGVV